eukprot:760217-Hanusia_phi.AAC.1
MVKKEKQDEGKGNGQATSSSEKIGEFADFSDLLALLNNGLLLVRLFAVAAEGVGKRVRGIYYVPILQTQSSSLSLPPPSPLPTPP